MENNKSLQTKPKILSDIYELFDVVIFSAVLVLVAFTLFFRIFVVSGPSMNPTLNDGDRLFVSDFLYQPKAGDIICFYSEHKDEVLVKRVIATEGQTVDIGNDLCVYVDGKKLDETYIAGANTLKYSTKLPYTVEKDHLFVMGDNRINSLDSRFKEIGTVKEEDVLGKLIFRIMPDFGKVD